MKILIATDGSSSARDAVAYAIELAAALEAELVVVHVAVAFDVVFGFPRALPHTPGAGERAALEEALKLAEAAGVSAHTQLLTGSTVDEIVAHADSIDADMIVVGSHGHGALGGTLLGSVSQGVLHEARRPVLVVRRTRERSEAASPAVAARR